MLGEQPLFGELAFGDVLRCPEDASKLARLVEQDVAYAADAAHLATGPDDSVLCVIALATLKPGRGIGDDVPVFRVNQLWQLSERDDQFPRTEPIDPVGLIGPD